MPCSRCTVSVPTSPPRYSCAVSNSGVRKPAPWPKCDTTYSVGLQGVRCMVGLMNQWCNHQDRYQDRVENAAGGGLVCLVC